MIVFRLSKAQFANDLSGKGAELVGGRWNSRGNAMLYTSQSIALCVTEIAVHVPLGILPKDFQLVHIEIPDEDFLELNENEIAKKYNTSDSRDWKIERAKADVKNNINNEMVWQNVNYRPFDIRKTFYTGKQNGFVCNGRFNVITIRLS